MHIESSMTYLAASFHDHASIWSDNGGCRCPRDGENVFGMDGIRASGGLEDEAGHFLGDPVQCTMTNEKLETAGAALGVKEISEMASLDGVLFVLERS